MDNETYALLENNVRNQLLALDEVSHCSKEEATIMDNVTVLTNLLITVDKNNDDYRDKEERRRIEEERNTTANQIEKDKQKITWGRVCFELAKVIVPSVISLIGYDIFQKRVMKFEETGRISSTAGRELHLPKFLK